VIILTLFGTTSGLELLHSPLANIPSTLKLDDAWVGINGSHATLLEDRDVHIVLRKSVGPHTATWIGLYRPARELGYDRPGGFYGAGAWLIDCATDVKQLTDALRDMAGQIQAKVMRSGRFVNRIADSSAEFAPPSQAGTLLASVSAIKGGCNPDGESAFVVAGADFLEVIDWAQRAPSASPFSKIIVSGPDQVPLARAGTGFSVFQSLAHVIDNSCQRLSNELHSERTRSSLLVQELARIESELCSARDEIMHQRGYVESASAAGERLQIVEAELRLAQSNLEILRRRTQLEPNRLAVATRSGESSPSDAGSSQGAGRHLSDPSLQAKKLEQLNRTSKRGFDWVFAAFMAVIVALIVFIGAMTWYKLRPSGNEAGTAATQQTQKPSSVSLPLPEEKGN
jgi:hypothetical protein